MELASVPRHVGIIMDGNRRFAKKLMLKPWMGHEWGAEKVKQLLEWCKELGIKEVTLYTFSVKNFNRPRDEFNFLMDLFEKEFSELKKEEHKIFENKIRVNFIGRLYLFPKKIQEVMQDIMEKTKHHDQYVVNFAMAYGGREEIIDATIKIAEQIKQGTLNINQINEETFSRNLYCNDEVDLVIRTSGEKRTSDFLPFQAHYAEWFFVEKHWPEFEKADFMEIISEFSQRQRRYGK